MSQDRFTVQHRPEESRYVLVALGSGDAPDVEAGEERYLDVDGQGRGERVLFHTLVHDEFGGQGLASALVRDAIESTVAGGRAVVPVCPYVAAWVKKHPEFAEHVVTPTPAHLQAVGASQA